VSSTSTADYQALLLMYKVSELLAGAADLDSFINSVADLVMEQVRADTVVVLSRSADGDVQPRVIRHRGALDPGEVPISRSIIEMVIRSRAPVISADALNDERIKAGQSLALYNIKAVLAAPLLLENDVRGVLYLNRSGPVPFTKADGELVAALAALLASSMERAELKERIIAEKQRRTQLERFHPPEVVDKLFAATDGLYGVEEHRVTALVCDMLGFEELTGSGAPPDFLAQVLTQYYELVYEKIFGNGGTLVKLHDGWALALFGMHGSVDRDAMWAIQAGRELCEEFSGLAQIWPEQANLSLRCALDSTV
jgi:adenylate cyclase